MADRVRSVIELQQGSERASSQNRYLVCWEQSLCWLKDHLSIVLLAVWDTWMWEDDSQLHNHWRCHSSLSSQFYPSRVVLLFRLQRYWEARARKDDPFANFTALFAMWKYTSRSESTSFVVYEWRTATYARYASSYSTSNDEIFWGDVYHPWCSRWMFGETRASRRYWGI